MYKYCLSLNISLLRGVKCSTLDITGCWAGTASGIDVVRSRRGQRQKKSPFKGEYCLCFSAGANMEHCPPTGCRQTSPNHVTGGWWKAIINNSTAQPSFCRLSWLFPKPRQITQSGQCRTRHSRGETTTVGAEGAKEGRCWGNWNSC